MLVYLLLFLIAAGSRAHGENCDPSDGKMHPLLHVAEQLECEIPLTCSDGKRFLGTQRAVDSDLLEDWVRKGPRRPATVVAVLDTGFDGERIRRGDIRIAKTIALKRSPADEDLIGHGTAVASLISGRDGIGISPHAEVWGVRMTRGSETTIVGAYALGKALEQCREGAEIINVSYGSPVAFEESEETMQELRERGCVIVKGAGNLGIEQHLTKEFWDRRDPVFRVEGINAATGRRPPQYDKGEWKMPGVDLTTLAPTWARRSSDCGELKIQRNDGSSGAAPLMSGLLAEVLSGLKAAPWYGELKGPRKVELLSYIIDEAAFSPGGVSAYLAVRIADQLAAGRLPKDLEKEVKAARAELSKDPVCKAEFAPRCDKEERKRKRLCGL